MIPKTIHYCWFGGHPLPEEYKSYMESWRKHCPDYEIVEWNENNFDVMENDYCKEAYEAKKWAFVSDYARLKIIYNYGGIYLDTDVELLKPLDALLKDGTGFVGMQNEEQINSGLGFAAAPNNSCVKKMMEIYETIHFKKEDGTYDMTPCPVINTASLKKCGLQTGRKFCRNIQRLDGISVLPERYCNPMDMDTMKLKIEPDTYMIHHYAASWYTDRQKRMSKLKRLMPRRILRLRTMLISKHSVKKFEHLHESLNR